MSTATITTGTETMNKANRNAKGGTRKRSRNELPFSESLADEYRRTRAEQSRRFAETMPAHLRSVHVLRNARSVENEISEARSGRSWFDRSDKHGLTIMGFF